MKQAKMDKLLGAERVQELPMAFCLTFCHVLILVF